MLLHSSCATTQSRSDAKTRTWRGTGGSTTYSAVHSHSPGLQCWQVVEFQTILTTAPTAHLVNASHVRLPAHPNRHPNPNITHRPEIPISVHLFGKSYKLALQNIDVIELVHRKTQRIWTRGAAPSSKPQSFSADPLHYRDIHI
mgnify:CR=1 FL=1